MEVDDRADHRLRLKRREGGGLDRVGVALGVAVILTLPFSSAFGLGPWLPLNLVTVLAFITWRALTHPLDALPSLWKRDILIVIAVGCGVFGLAFAPAFGSRTQNHTLAIVSCVLGYYLLLRGNLLNRVASIRLSKWLAYAGLVSSIFVIIEFAISNFLGLSMRDFIPYVEIRNSLEDIPDSTMLDRWVRPRGFAIEAGHMGTFFEVAIPLSWLWLRTKRAAVRSAFYIVMLVGFTLLASAAATTALIVGVVALIFRGSSDWRTRAGVLIAGGIAIGVWLTTDDVRETFDMLVANKALSYVGVRRGDDFSGLDRSMRARTAIAIAEKYVLGIGWGTAPHLAMTTGLEGFDVPFGFISLYAEFLVAGGWIALICFIGFVGTSIWTVWRSPDSGSGPLLVATIAIAVHYLAISNYWFPSFWLPFALIGTWRASETRNRG